MAGARFAIIGVGATTVGQAPLHVSSARMFCDAAIAAIADAGIDKAEIDGVVTHGVEDDRLHHQRMAGLLGLRADFSTSHDNGGASQVTSIITACLAIEAGLCSTVLCGYAADYSARIRRAGTQQSVSIVPEHLLAEEFRYEFGYFGEMATYSFGAQRHMHLYGTTREELAEVAITQRNYARANPQAQFRTPITRDDYFKSPRIVDPFGRLDCCPVSDGGGAVIVTRADRDLPKSAAHILGYAIANNVSGLMADDNMIVTGGARASKRAYRMAGVMPADVDVAQFYDTTTSQVVIQLEDYGFCAKGEGGPFVASGAIGPRGSIPTNTAGGLLSEGHTAGMLHIVEAVRQVRQSLPPDRQIPGAEIAVVSGNGGNTVCHGALVLGRSPN
jgi:acetyl-CoA acetyltransferase